MSNASHKGMGAKGDGSGAGANSGDPRDTNMLGEEQLAEQLMGRNNLQGDDQVRARNQRQGGAEEKLRPDAGPLESAEMLDKDARAEGKLGKGRGVHPGKAGGGA
jgi:hypothetical protein